jgi:hypothetical protein
MKLLQHKLTFEPQLFVGQPNLLATILAQEITTEDQGEVARFYTKCGCREGKAYWQEMIVDKHTIEIFACGYCNAWSMSVTY